MTTRAAPPRSALDAEAQCERTAHIGPSPDVLEAIEELVAGCEMNLDLLAFSTSDDHELARRGAAEVRRLEQALVTSRTLIGDMLEAEGLFGDTRCAHDRSALDAAWDSIESSLRKAFMRSCRAVDEDIDAEITRDAWSTRFVAPLSKVNACARTIRLPRLGTTRARRSSRPRRTSASSTDSPSGSSDPAPPSAGTINRLRRSFALLTGGAR